MAVREHIRITARGVFGPANDPIEEWAWSIRAVTPDPATPIGQLGPRDLALDVRDLVKDYHSESTTKINAIAKLTEVTMAWIGTDDRVKTDANGAYLQWKEPVVDPLPGNSAANLKPLQVSTCVSLVTARGGATGKGRFYLPAPAFELGANATISGSDAQALANTTGAFLSELNAAFDSAAPGPGVRIAVVSSKGYASLVTGVKVGVVLDTQRRRRSELPEAYAASAVDQNL